MQRQSNNSSCLGILLKIFQIAPKDYVSRGLSSSVKRTTFGVYKLNTLIVAIRGQITACKTLRLALMFKPVLLKPLKTTYA